MVFVRFSQPFWAGAAVALPPGASAKAIPAPATSATARVARRWFRSMADSFVTGARSAPCPDISGVPGRPRAETDRLRRGTGTRHAATDLPRTRDRNETRAPGTEARRWAPQRQHPRRRSHHAHTGPPHPPAHLRGCRPRDRDGAGGPVRVQRRRRLGHLRRLGRSAAADASADSPAKREGAGVVGQRGTPDQAAKPADAAAPPSRRSTFDRKLARRADISITVADVDVAAAKVRAIAASAKGLVDGRGDLERARRPRRSVASARSRSRCRPPSSTPPSTGWPSSERCTPATHAPTTSRAVRRHRVAGQDHAGQRRPGACADEPGHQARRDRRARGRALPSPGRPRGHPEPARRPQGLGGPVAGRGAAEHRRAGARAGRRQHRVPRRAQGRLDRLHRLGHRAADRASARCSRSPSSRPWCSCRCWSGCGAAPRAAR